MSPLHQTQSVCHRKLITLISALVFCLLGEVHSLHAACGDWLSTKSALASHLSRMTEDSGTLIDTTSSKCGCKKLQCHSGNSEGQLPDPIIRPFEGEWGILQELVQEAGVRRAFFRVDEAPLHVTTSASSIFHPPRCA